MITKYIPLYVSSSASSLSMPFRHCHYHFYIIYVYRYVCIWKVCTYMYLCKYRWWSLLRGYYYSYPNTLELFQFLCFSLLAHSFRLPFPFRLNGDSSVGVEMMLMIVLWIFKKYYWESCVCVMAWVLRVLVLVFQNRFSSLLIQNACHTLYIMYSGRDIRPFVLDNGKHCF